MEKNGFEREIEVANRLIESLFKSDLKVIINDKWRLGTSTSYFDIVIYKGVFPIAVFEIKTNIENKNILARAKDQIRSAISLTNSRFGIVTDNEKFLFYDRTNTEFDFKEVSFDEIINQLINPEKITISEEDKQVVLDIIIGAANNYLKDNLEFLSFIKSRLFLNKIIFNQNSNTFCFSDDDGGTSSFENQFFIKMFGEFKETKICRYTSLKTIYEMLNNISFRMHGIVGMNDKSEVNYVETYLNRGDNLLSIAKPINKEHTNTIMAINNRYITSCSKIDRRDDLTLWRLYSEDAKGVCLIYDVKKINLDKHILLQKVKYADEKGNHIELDFLKHIKIEVERKTRYKFEFRKLGYWKHFFKAKDYSIEEEVRLLVIDNDSLSKLKTDWVMTYTHSIFNPIIDFRLNSKSFPIQLKEILLGPKCPEQETNFVQLQEMLRRKKREIKEKGYDSNFRDLKVELSNIKHYR